MPNGGPPKEQALQSDAVFRAWVIAHGEYVEKWIDEATRERGELLRQIRSKVDKSECEKVRAAQADSIGKLSDAVSRLSVAVARWAIPVAVIVVASAVAMAVTRL